MSGDIANLHIVEIDFPDLQEKFIEKLHLKIEEIEASLQSHSFAEVVRLAHTLRGSCGMYGLPTLCDLAGEMEENGKNGKTESFNELLERMKGINQILTA